MNGETPILREIGDRIRRSRKAMGLEQAQLAGLLGVSVRAVGAWEAGDYTPERDNLRNLAVVLQRSPRWIMEGEDEVSARLRVLEERIKNLEERLTDGDS